MTTKRLGRGLGMAMMVVAAVGIPSLTAYADANCYTGCSPTQTGGGGGTVGGGTGTKTGGGGGTLRPITKSAGSGTGSSGSGTGAKTTSQSTSTSGGSLPFTGADIEEMAALGGGALLVGGVLVRRSRHRRRAQA